MNRSVNKHKSRCTFRCCNICKKEPIPNQPDNPMVSACNCKTSYVHYKCQAELMITQGIIDCPQCKVPYQGVEYTKTKKNFAQYVWEESNARGNFVTTLSMIVSLIVILATLTQLDFVGLWGEFKHFELSIDKESLKHDLNIIMLLYMKLILPLQSFIVTIIQVISLASDFW